MWNSSKLIQDQIDNIELANEATKSISRTLKELDLMKRESRCRIILYESCKDLIPNENWMSLGVDEFIDYTARKLAEIR